MRIAGKDGIGTRYSTPSQVMEFDHVIRVHKDGSISEPSGVYAPEVTWSDGTHHVSGDGWSLMNGYSSQYLYSGPVMHPSEYIGGGLERDILSQPGYYVAVAVDALDCEDHPDTEECDCDRNAGWAVAFQPAHADYPHEPGRLYDCEVCESQCFCGENCPQCKSEGTTDTCRERHTECVYCAEH